MRGEMRIGRITQMKITNYLTGQKYHYHNITVTIYTAKKKKKNYGLKSRKEDTDISEERK